MFHIAYTLMQIPVGILADRFNSKTILASAFFIASCGTVIFANADSYLVGSIAQALLGIGSSFAFVLLMKVANDIFPREKVGLMSSVGLSAGALGAVLMSPLFAYLASLYTWRTVVLGFGLLGLALTLVIFFAADGGKQESSNNSNEERVGVCDSLKAVFANPQFIYMGLFSMAILGPFVSFCNAWGVSFVKCVYNADKIESASVVSLMNFGAIFGAPLAAVAAAKLGSYKKVMVYGSIAFIALFATALFVKTDLIVLGVLLFAIGIIMNCEFLSFPAALSLASPKIAATLMSVMNMITMAGAAVMIPTIGAIMDFSKNSAGVSQTYSPLDYKVGMIAIVVMLAFAIIVTCFIKDGKESRVESEKKIG